MPVIAGMAYVPGMARGVLSRTPRPGAIWLARQTDLHLLPVKAAGVVVVEGAPFSHAMIGLLSQGLPTVLLTDAQAAELKEGESVVLDAARGRVLPPDTPDAALTPAPPTPGAGQAVHTADGAAVMLCASVRNANGARLARERGAAAIGLVRSEFLVPAGDEPPDAEYFEQALDTLCEAAAPLTVNIRLIDIAADKRPAWLGASIKGARLELISGYFVPQAIEDFGEPRRLAFGFSIFYTAQQQLKGS